MKNTAEKEKRMRLLLLSLGALSVGCAVLTAVLVLLGKEHRMFVPAALASALVVSAVAVALSRMQEEAKAE